MLTNAYVRCLRNIAKRGFHSLKTSALIWPRRRRIKVSYVFVCLRRNVSVERINTRAEAAHMVSPSLLFQARLDEFVSQQLLVLWNTASRCYFLIFCGARGATAHRWLVRSKSTQFISLLSYFEL